MLKKLLLLCAFCVSSIQAASAAPSGWYDLSLTWRDGAFSGRVLYDAGSPYQVSQVDGILTDPAQATAIRDVWNLSTGTPLTDMPLTFTNWADPTDPLNYNAAFSLVLLDLGASLAVADPGPAWGLYDWSNPTYFEQLSDSPLTAWSIAPSAAEVPEPFALSLLGIGFAGLMFSVAATQAHAPDYPKQITRKKP